MSGRAYFRDGGRVTVGAGATVELVADTAPHGDPIDLEALLVTPNQAVPIGDILISIRINGLDVQPYIRMAAWQRSQSEGNVLPLELAVPGGARYAVVAISSAGLAYDLTAAVAGRYRR